MILMKKLLTTAIIIMLCIPLLGFNVDFGAITNRNGTVKEYVSLYCNSTTLDELNISQAELNQILFTASGDVVSSIRTIFTNKINADTELNVETKQNYLKDLFFSAQVLENKFFISISYGSEELWKYFCEEEDLSSQEFHYFFLTYDVIKTIKPRISSLAINDVEHTFPQYVYQILSGVLINELGQEASALLNNPDYSYSYVTTKRRVHSNAEEIFSNNGFFYHTWSLADINNSQITIYATYANSVVWYLFALSFTSIFLLAILVKSKYLKQKIQTEEN